MAATQTNTTLFVPDVTKVIFVPPVQGHDFTGETVTWERGRDRMEVKRSVCAGCGGRRPG